MRFTQGATFILAGCYSAVSREIAGSTAVAGAVSTEPPPPTLSMAKHATVEGNDNVLLKSGHFEGDIAATYEEIERDFSRQVAEKAKAFGELEKPRKGGPHLRGLGAPTTKKHLLWPNKTLYWTWSWDIYDHLPSRNAVAAAHYYINLNTDINLVYGIGSGNFVHVIKGGGCWSYVGVQGGKQGLSIGNGCESRGIAIHEFLHALGFWHEQSSLDRDDYVDIYPENMISGTSHNFQKRHDTATYGFKFDYGSLMQYGEYAFSKNGQKTINCRGHYCGQRSGMSQSDIETLNHIYANQGN
eukprot:CAMPEP_0203784288 /NCGR_PEP_ID=MMETSP0100_2-20121128/381_1 /ASSEMBLY_ACC=CAM_ASM_000210 /TAXON_ID=96639 /ORGANISM=" , Strain NY0313808BC1" /LENGTH=298 /DNA_ID=CAMNT_0050686249 /DNA_START=177 /DNA_END=1073 /DNA_ORIENTATION=-